MDGKGGSEAISMVFATKSEIFQVRAEIIFFVLQAAHRCSAQLGQNSDLNMG
ncbi:hypothetical protein ACERK3_13750 [Phycisphaerales bacterium AB-hyl4]|uniref:Uncharacterized protein n=1 Tax=Natronomicrosphaera hydrolytica TaxID=3242702 RepID=A0ABV4UA14_9BACT